MSGGGTLPHMAHTLADKPWIVGSTERAESRRRNQGWWVLIVAPVAIVAGALILSALGVNHRTANHALVMESCTSAYASGTVRNTSGEMSDLSIWVNFVDSRGVQVTSGVASIYKLAPGGTARWKAEPAALVQAGFECQVARVYQYRS